MFPIQQLNALKLLTFHNSTHKFLLSAKKNEKKNCKVSCYMRTAKMKSVTNVQAVTSIEEKKKIK